MASAAVLQVCETKHEECHVKSEEEREEGNSRAEGADEQQEGEDEPALLLLVPHLRSLSLVILTIK